MNTEALLTEALALAEKINKARFEGDVPTDYDTVRLCEVLSCLYVSGKPLSDSILQEIKEVA